MTFEQLQETAKEQQLRTFSLECSVAYNTEKTFTAYHFQQLKFNMIEHSCWEALIKLNFPFEDVVINIDSVFYVADNVLTPKSICEFSCRFGVFIINQACMSLDNMKGLIYNFVEIFDRQFTHTFQVPAELKRSTTLLNIHYTHSMFTVLHDNHLI